MLKQGALAPPLALHVIDTLGTGGAEQALVNLVRNLDPLRYRALVYPLRALGPHAGALRTEGFLAADDVPKGRMAQLRGLRAFIKRHRPAIVHTHLNHSDFFGGPLARMCGVPVVLSYKASILRGNADRQRVYNVITRAAARFNTFVVVLSHALERHLSAGGIVPAARLRVVHYGVPIDDRPANPSLRASLAPGGGRIVLLPARLEPRKDHAMFLRAAALVQAALPDTHFLLAGDGEPGYRAALEADARRLGVRATFLGARSDVADLMRASDLVALSSTTEGLGLVLLEAMAARRAVVATAVGGVPEVVADGETGVLVPAGDAGQMANAMIALLSDDARRGRMGEAGRRRVESRFTLAAMGGRMADVYDEALASVKARA